MTGELQPIDTDDYGGANASAPLSNNTLSDLCDKWCPYYLAIGMTWGQYWNESPEIAKFYREAEKIRRDKKNEELWLQGFYIHEAMLATPIVVRGYAKKDTPQTKYPVKPHPITLAELKAEQEAEEKAKQRKFKEYMRAFATTFNEKRRAKNG